ncbi:MAG TPA: DUF1259 domain-containing protein [Gemmatimonadaceae bacterium]
MLRLILTGFAVAIAFQPVSAQGRPDNARSWAEVETALGRTGAAQPGGVIRFGFPRSDLAVTLDGVALKPALALGGWLAFKPLMAGSALVMGDLVLTEKEVPTVMRELQSGGIEETALHNHLLRETPHVMYMHVMGRGNATAIAATVRRALSQTNTPMASTTVMPGQPTTIPAPAPNPTTSDLDTARIAQTLGASGRLNGVVYQVSVPRRERITLMGEEVPPSLGVATAINFQPTGAGKAAITGDFVLREAEVGQVMRALRAGGIEITALHSHMIDEQPRLLFMHFWANDDAVRLAGVLRGALDLIAK